MIVCYKKLLRKPDVEKRRMMMSSKKVVCKLCGQDLACMTYSVTMEKVFMHRDLTGAQCRRIQKQNKRAAAK